MFATRTLEMRSACVHAYASRFLERTCICLLQSRPHSFRNVAVPPSASICSQLNSMRWWPATHSHHIVCSLNLTLTGTTHHATNWWMRYQTKVLLSPVCCSARLLFYTHSHSYNMQTYTLNTHTHTNMRNIWNIDWTRTAKKFFC